jgi:exodeoxyribonuclease V alpha subunit
MSAPTEVLAGLVDGVTFHNDENGFCVLRVKARGQRAPITVIGHTAMISAGEFVQASGSWINDRTHGVQFRSLVPKGDGADHDRGGSRNILAPA